MAVLHPAIVMFSVSTFFIVAKANLWLPGLHHPGEGMPDTPLFGDPPFFAKGPPFFGGNQGNEPSASMETGDESSSGGQPEVSSGGTKERGGEIGTEYKGGWELVSSDSGVSAMHLQLLMNNKVLMFDATTLMPAKLKFDPGNCRMDRTGKDKIPREDCWVHAVEYDIETAALRKLKVLTNPWCASGTLSPDGTLVQTGGWNDGGKAVRYYSPCENCEWEEYPEGLSAQRWYATQQQLPDGRFFVVGGRRQFNYEYVPAKRGEANRVNYELPFLRQTTDDVENNLYPFVHLSTDGNLFIFANNRSILFNPTTNSIVREFPVLNGGSRNYPASAMSALLPLRLRGKKVRTIPAEVLVCGGTQPYSARRAAKGQFLPALRSCGRITITSPNAAWKTELMPEPRVMGDMLLLPNTDVLMLNGAKKGTAGWGFATDPYFEPVLYKYKKSRRDRFVTLAPSTIPRMYHSSSAVLPDGRILVAGSNPNNAYVFKGVPHPTELRVEKFSPPYLDPLLANQRPEIDTNSAPKEIKYEEVFQVMLSLAGVPDLRAVDVQLTMYAPPFTTHGYSMNQRLLILQMGPIQKVGQFEYQITVVAPPSAVIAPQGYYLFFVVHKGLPSKGVWIHVA